MPLLNDLPSLNPTDDDAGRSKPTALVGVHPLRALNINFEEIAAKYAQERQKRLRQDGNAQFQSSKGSLTRFRDDSQAPPRFIRDRVERQTKVVIIGAGISGIVAAVKLKQHGIHDVVIVDEASGFGGVWYWNHFPGICCDIESYNYLPFLEETGYIPQYRFASGPEIVRHIDRVVDKWRLKEISYLQTKITSAHWDESKRRWDVYTDRDDHFVAQFVVMAIGILNEPQLPGIPGIDDFQRDSFHSSRWNYNITGGNDEGNMTRLADKTVGVIGNGASGINLMPHIAKSAKRLLFFQRTPCTISMRQNWKTPADFGKNLESGWQVARMGLMAAHLAGEIEDCTASEGIDCLNPRKLFVEAQQAGVEIGPQDIPELMQLANLRWMESLRKTIQDTVKDQETAEKLKPWYAFMCKRPLFHENFYSIFNMPNVQLIDTDGKGVSRLTKTGVVANGEEYEVDLLVFATGFESAAAPNLEKRNGMRIVGSKGQTIDEASAKSGPSTMFGIHYRDFPNFFNITQVQSGLALPWTQLSYVASDQIAHVIAEILRDGAYEVVEPSEDGVASWAEEMASGWEMMLPIHLMCTPSYYNGQGNPEKLGPLWQPYQKGVVAWSNVMQKWREEGNMEGLERR